MKASLFQQTSSVKRINCLLIQQQERSQTFTRVSMCPEYTNGKISEPPIQVKCKIDTGAGSNIMPIYVFRKLCLAMFDSSGKALKEQKLDVD